MNIGDTLVSNSEIHAALQIWYEQHPDEHDPDSACESFDEIPDSVQILLNIIQRNGAQAITYMRNQIESSSAGIRVGHIHFTNEELRHALQLWEEIFDTDGY